MVLTYTFNGEDYSYEVNDYDVRNYILRTHEPDEIVFDYYQYIYPNESEDSKKVIEDDFGFDGREESINEMDIESLELLAEEVVDDLIDLDLYNDELYNYFEDEAYEEYESSPEWEEWQAEYDKQRL